MIESQQNQAQLPPVIRLLRCSKTHRYFKNGGWTEDPYQAEMYQDELEAVRTCIEQGLHNVELVLRPRGGTTDLFCTTIC